MRLLCFMWPIHILDAFSLRSVIGGLVFFHGLGNRVLVLNSLKAINHLFDMRGQIYSDRPVFTVVGELMGLSWVRIDRFEVFTRS